MIFCLIAVVLASLALYETGYGVTANLPSALLKQAVIQSTTIASFLLSSNLFFHTELIPPPLIASVGFLCMLAYIATTSLTSLSKGAAIASIIGGLMFPALMQMVRPGGYLYEIGFQDAIGGGLIHFGGGVVACIVGWYVSRVVGTQRNIARRPVLATLGFVGLWLGWVSYIAVTSASMFSDPAMWFKGIINMSTGTAWGAAASVLYMHMATKRVKMKSCTIGGLAGMVAMSADPYSAPFWAAALLGGIAGVLSGAVHGLLHRLRIADPVNAIAIHMVPGLLGLLTVPIFNPITSLSTQMVGGAAVFIAAVSLGVAVCELHTITPKLNAAPR